MAIEGDGLNLNAQFNATPITDGIDKAAASVKQGTEQMKLGFQEAGKAAQQMSINFGDVGTTAGTASEKITAASATAATTVGQVRDNLSALAATAAMYATAAAEAGADSGRLTTQLEQASTATNQEKQLSIDLAQALGQLAVQFDVAGTSAATATQKFAQAREVRVGDYRDILFPQAVDIVQNAGKVSTSMLQRELRIGFGRATEIAGQLMAEGVVQPWGGERSGQFNARPADLADSTVATQQLAAANAQAVGAVTQLQTALQQAGVTLQNQAAAATGAASATKDSTSAAEANTSATSANAAAAQQNAVAQEQSNQGRRMAAQAAQQQGQATMAAGDAAVAAAAMTTEAAALIQSTWGKVAKAPKDVREAFQQMSQVSVDSAGRLQIVKSFYDQIADSAVSAAGSIDANRAALQQNNIIVEQGVGGSKQMVQAIQFLNDKEALAKATAQEVAQAWAVLNKEAERLGLQVNRTAQGFEVTSQAQERTAASAGAVNSRLAGAAAQMLAMEAGAGKLGYTMRIVASTLGPMSALFQYAFPVIFAVAMIDVVTELKNKLEEMAEKVRKNAADWANLGIEARHQTEQMTLSILQLDDKITQFNSRPVLNNLKEALIENKLKTDELNKSLNTAIEKSLELLRAGKVGFFKSLVTGTETTTDIVQALKIPYEEIQMLDAQRAEAAATGNKKVEDSLKEEIKQRRQQMLTIVAQKQAELDKQKAQMVESVEAGNIAREMSAADAHASALASVNTQYFQKEAILRNLRITLLEMANAEALLTEANAKRLEEGREADSRNLRASNYGIEEARIKAADTVAQGQIRNADRAANDELAAQRKKYEALLADDTKNADEKLSAEIVALEVEKTIYANHAIDLLDIEQNRYNRELSALQRHKDNVNANLRGDERTKELLKVNADIQKAMEDHEGNIFSIATKNEEAQADITKKQHDKDLALTKRYYDEVIAADAVRVSQGIQSRKDHLELVALLYGEDSKQYSAAQKKFIEEDKKIAVKQQEAKVAAFRVGTEEREAEEIKLLELVKKLYGEDSTEYAAQLKRREDEHRKYIDARRRVEEDSLRTTDTLAQIRAEGDRAAYEATLPAIQQTSRAAIKAEQEFENQLYNSRLQLMEALAKLYQDDYVKWAQIKNQELVLDQQHQKKLADIERRGMQDRMNLYNAVNASMERGWSQLMMAFVTDWRKLGQALQNLWMSILQDFANFLAKKLQMWIEEHILEKIWAAIFGDSGDEKDKVKNTQETNQAIAASNAAAAGAATLALTSAMYPPPAPEALAAMAYGVGMTFAGLAGGGFFAKGGIVPEDMPAFVHAREMVLPPHLSTGLQGAIERGSFTSNETKQASAPTLMMPISIHGATDPDAVAKKVSDVVMARVKSYYRSNGVWNR